MRSEHLRVSEWQDLKGDQNMICDKFRPRQQRTHPLYLHNVDAAHLNNTVCDINNFQHNFIFKKKTPCFPMSSEVVCLF